MTTWNKDFDFSPIGKTPEYSADTLGWSPLMQALLKRDEGYLCEGYASGNIAPEAKKEIQEAVLSKQGRLIYKNSDHNFDKCIWIWEDGIVELTFSNETSVVLSILSFREEFVTELKELVRSKLTKPSKHGHVYVIVSQGGRLALSSLGNAGVPLVPYNYNTKVLEDYKLIIKDLKSTSPSGRITILEGEPGTGKTHLVRSMLLDVPDAMFVLVPPDMVASLGGPELLPLLLNYKNSSPGPIILILEDADKCLVVRDNLNINAIQSVLNLGDGILGSLLDLRIIATTNANHLEMEPAVLRAGRLSKRLEVTKLDVLGAITTFKNLLPGVDIPEELSTSLKTDVNSTYSLAEVYALARREGWTSEVRKTMPEQEEDEDIY